MPFAGYKDWEDCIRKNRNKGNPEAYCGSIKHQVEGADEMVKNIPSKIVASGPVDKKVMVAETFECDKKHKKVKKK